MAKCKNCRNYYRSAEWCNAIGDSPDKDKQRDCIGYLAMTNADRIRSMSDEELGELLKRVKADYQWMNPEYPSEEDYGEWINWLQQEVEG